MILIEVAGRRVVVSAVAPVDDVGATGDEVVAEGDVLRVAEVAVDGQCTGHAAATREFLAVQEHGVVPHAHLHRATVGGDT